MVRTGRVAMVRGLQEREERGTDTAVPGYKTDIIS
jgi:hypothetical protein